MKFFTAVFAVALITCTALTAFAGQWTGLNIPGLGSARSDFGMATYQGSDAQYTADVFRANRITGTVPNSNVVFFAIVNYTPPSTATMNFDIRVTEYKNENNVLRTYPIRSLDLQSDWDHFWFWKVLDVSALPASFTVTFNVNGLKVGGIDIQ